MDISTADWYDNLDTTIQAAFNISAMTTLTPSQVIFGAAEAYRETQEVYNSGATVESGAYINFASPISQDTSPSRDNTGAISANKAIVLRAKVVYLPVANVQPQQSLTII